ncbi:MULTISPECIES: DUF2196 domain-containing protein [unclassified Ruegeria]|uniref:DUF2196 domain-containing protein n=1 Tax=unclassified Ruegeria TaxID=2625375 RepID=UPI001492C616|nr:MULTISPECIES: DUF2196 domain-containing protein [unclassified Ruegeria]NOD36653.1 DUF2196 domain-containing protein [Ruegeria sp. HKCCD7296]NOE43848.1 DUF2196 domain-containing protein [Ruegeria sp. HKCCD7319]
MDVSVGQVVQINPRSDRTRKLLVKGVVAEVLTRNRNHPHGILVKLESGEIGRVKSKGGYSTSDNPASVSEQKPLSDKQLTLEEVISLGENHHVEFKSDALWSSNYSSEDIKNHRPQSKELHIYGKAVSKIIIAKSIAGFLNSDGGLLVIGVRENKETGIDEVIGVEREFEKLKDQSQDGYRRMIVDLVKDYFPSAVFNHLNSYLQIDFEEIDGLLVCGVRVTKSDRRVFLKLKGADYFFIRTDASTRELIGEEILDYCEKRFA